MVEVKKEQYGFLSAYYVYKMHENDIKKEGKREGILEGIEQNKLETAKNLLKMNVNTHEQIAQATGLPLETVEELAKQL